MLKESQLQVYDEVIHSIEADNEKRNIIKGSAGTGKTFLTKSIVEYFANKKSRWDESKVWVTAPTNKALSILQNKIGPHRAIQFSTTHSALKLKRYINPQTGVASFVPPKKNYGDPPFNKCTLAIVDECSMLNSSLISYLDKFSFPIIFVGDDKQLNPVGEFNTPIFERTYPEFELTEIIRQGAGNPIIDLSRDLDMIWFKQPTLIEDKGYIFNDDKLQIIENLAEVNGTDDLKYLAYTNRNVDEMNKLVRERIYGKPRRIELGESIIFKEPFGDYWTNQEVKVRQLDIIENRQFNVPNAKTRYTSDGDWLGPSTESFKVYMINSNIPIIHEDDDMKFLAIKKDILSNCNSYGWDWRGYYYFLEQFANITYNHAISVHKSQGSTYKESIINVGDLNICKNVEERQRLFYTAVTRASDLLILANVK